MCSGSEVSSFTIMQLTGHVFAWTETTWQSCCVTLWREVTEHSSWEAAASAQVCTCVYFPFLAAWFPFHCCDFLQLSPARAAPSHRTCLVLDFLERCSVREGALRINWDRLIFFFSHSGVLEDEKGQSSNMQSGMLKGRFGFNCSRFFSPDGGGFWGWCNRCFSFPLSTWLLFCLFFGLFLLIFINAEMVPSSDFNSKKANRWFIQYFHYPLKK